MMTVDKVNEYTPEMRALLRRSQYVTYLTYLTKFGVSEEHIYSLLDDDIQYLSDAENSVCLTASDNELRGVLVGTFLQWDTAHFGFPCYKINYFFSDEALPKEDTFLKRAMLRTFKEKVFERDARLIVGRVAASDWGSLWALEDAGFNLVDTLVVLAKNIVDKPLTIQEALPFPTKVIKGCPATLLPKLESILKDALPSSRFVIDFRFPPGSGERVYLQWLEKVCQKSVQPGKTYLPVHSEEGHKGEGEEPLILQKSKDEVVGFITYKAQQALEVGSIELIVVSPTYRGMQVGDYLIRLVENELQGKGISTLEVTTYLYNYSALNAYVRSSFEVVSSIYTFHLWL